jgi:intraflagellar transport protein 88
MKHDPCIKTGDNVILCHSVLSSLDEVKVAYVRLLAVKPVMLIQDLGESDVLGTQLHIERREQVRLVMVASRLVAEKSDKDWQSSSELAVEQLKQSKYPEAAGEFEIVYSLAFLNHRDATKAIDMMRQIRKKDNSLITLAATRLLFVYFLEQNYADADKYTVIVLEHDKYNTQALVNERNCFMQGSREDEARD